MHGVTLASRAMGRSEKRVVWACQSLKTKTFGKRNLTILGLIWASFGGLLAYLSPPSGTLWVELLQDSSKATQNRPEKLPRCHKRIHFAAFWVLLASLGRLFGVFWQFLSPLLEPLGPRCYKRAKCSKIGPRGAQGTKKNPKRTPEN